MQFPTRVGLSSKSRWERALRLLKTAGAWRRDHSVLRHHQARRL